MHSFKKQTNKENQKTQAFDTPCNEYILCTQDKTFYFLA